MVHSISPLQGWQGGVLVTSVWAKDPGMPRCAKPSRSSHEARRGTGPRSTGRTDAQPGLPWTSSSGCTAGPWAPPRLGGPSVRPSPSREARGGRMDSRTPSGAAPDRAPGSLGPARAHAPEEAGLSGRCCVTGGPGPSRGHREAVGERAIQGTSKRSTSVCRLHGFQVTLSA